MKTANLLRSAAAIVLACASGEARAQNLTEKLITVDPGFLVNGTFTGASSPAKVLSGVCRFTTFEAFCVEPSQSLYYNETLIYQVQDISTLAEHDTVSRLVSAYLQSTRTAQDAAAVQWAIWETIAENTLPDSLADGNVRIDESLDHATLALANHYLATAMSYQPASLTYLTNATRQDMVTWNAVPEPGSIMLGLASALLLARRKR